MPLILGPTSESILAPSSGARLNAYFRAYYISLLRGLLQGLF
jgi:hypothetical protein